MYFEDMTEEEIFIENMKADEIAQEREYREMEAMYLDNQLEV